MVKQVTDATFASETKNGVVLIDFWAPWCGPCRIQGPILDELAAEMGDKVTIAKVDVDQNPATASKFGIMSIPTLMVKKDDKVVETLVGVHRKEQLASILEKYL
ncbi:thioredoxin [Vagococcus lutrae]|uniref:Thioredoxin n=1 Tax=Vagococcus lutrae TaxID=81947 RepID=A0AAE9XKW1_9ENTE|nr:thioredoxin [Vagococcus lutrae]MDO5741893.1 thioredoxin [Vagococcus sp.]MCO7151176.1 thioredoxin [Vagococcus lutrae]MDT2802342.1 thioredoxin [Vagococcus lutrae]MDT2806208.1 thioredoxin [Vagococcus lutrae]MDT2808845.1 thioredoxin [Vagococcus lutrae]